MLLKLNYRFINFSIIITLHITEASIAQCTWRIRKVIGFDKIFVLPTISSS